jgi:hypothetical protein
MLRFKACPRCHGDLLVDSDYHGHFACCIQCGAYFDQPQQALSQRRAASGADADRPMQTAVALETGSRKVA